MGDDSHLHDFRVGQRRFGRPDPDDRLMGLAALGNERTARLSTVLGKVGAKAVYTYDSVTAGSIALLLKKC